MQETLHIEPNKRTLSLETVEKKPIIDLFNATLDYHITIKKHGNVLREMDKQIQKLIYNVEGNISTGNYIEIMHKHGLKSTNSLSSSSQVTARYIYVQMRLTHEKLPVTIHFDVITKDKTKLRYTLSTLYKKYRIMRNGLRVPLRDRLSTNWTVLVIDMAALLQLYYGNSTENEHGALECIKLCSSMYLRTVYFSESLYTNETIPKHMMFYTFPIQKMTGGKTLLELADLVWVNLPEQDVTIEVAPVEQEKSKLNGVQKKTIVTTVLKGKGHNSLPSKNGHITVSKETHQKLKSGLVTTQKSTKFSLPGLYKKGPLQIYRLLAPPLSTSSFHFCGITMDELIFSSSSILIGMKLQNVPPILSEKSIAQPPSLEETPTQRFFIGHSTSIMLTSFNHSLTTVASSDSKCMIHFWQYTENRRIGTLETHYQSLSILQFSSNDSLLLVFGRKSSRATITIYNIASLQKSHTIETQFPIIVTQSTETSIHQMMFSVYDMEHMISCGKENLRIWRIQNGRLSSNLIDCKDYAKTNEFLDIAFDEFYTTSPQDIERQISPLYVADYYGRILVFNFQTLDLQYVYQLHEGPIRQIFVTHGYAVTGSDDGYLRLWSLDFTDILLDCHLQEPIETIRISKDGLQVAYTTVSKKLGVVNVPNRYSQSFFSPIKGEILAMTTSKDYVAFAYTTGVIRVCNINEARTSHEFTFKEEKCLSLSFLSSNVLAAGFYHGKLRILELESLQVYEDYDVGAGIQSIYTSKIDRRMAILTSRNHVLMFQRTATQERPVIDFGMVQNFTERNNDPLEKGELHRSSICMTKDLSVAVYACNGNLLWLDLKKSPLQIVGSIQCTLLLNAQTTILQFSPSKREILVLTSEYRIHWYKHENTNLTLLYSTTPSFHGEILSFCFLKEKELICLATKYHLQVWRYEDLIHSTKVFIPSKLTFNRSWNPLCIQSIPGIKIKSASSTDNASTKILVHTEENYILILDLNQSNSLRISSLKDPTEISTKVPSSAEVLLPDAEEEEAESPRELSAEIHPIEQQKNTPDTLTLKMERFIPSVYAKRSATSILWLPQHTKLYFLLSESQVAVESIPEKTQKLLAIPREVEAILKLELCPEDQFYVLGSRGISFYSQFTDELLFFSIYPWTSSYTVLDVVVLPVTYALCFLLRNMTNLLACTLNITKHKFSKPKIIGSIDPEKSLEFVSEWVEKPFPFTALNSKKKLVAEKVDDQFEAGSESSTSDTEPTLIYHRDQPTEILDTTSTSFLLRVVHNFAPCKYMVLQLNESSSMEESNSFTLKASTIKKAFENLFLSELLGKQGVIISVDAELNIVIYDLLKKKQLLKFSMMNPYNGKKQIHKYVPKQHIVNGTLWQNNELSAYTLSFITIDKSKTTIYSFDIRDEQEEELQLISWRSFKINDNRVIAKSALALHQSVLVAQTENLQVISIDLNKNTGDSIPYFHQMKDIQQMIVLSNTLCMIIFQNQYLALWSLRTKEEIGRRKVPCDRIINAYKIPSSMDVILLCNDDLVYYFNTMELCSIALQLTMCQHTLAKPSIEINDEKISSIGFISSEWMFIGTDKGRILEVNLQDILPPTCATPVDTLSTKALVGKRFWTIKDQRKDEKIGNVVEIIQPFQLPSQYFGASFSSIESMRCNGMIFKVKTRKPIDKFSFSNDRMITSLQFSPMHEEHILILSTEPGNTTNLYIRNYLQKKTVQYIPMEMPVTFFRMQLTDQYLFLMNSPPSSEKSHHQMLQYNHETYSLYNLRSTRETYSFDHQTTFYIGNQQLVSIIKDQIYIWRFTK